MFVVSIFFVWYRYGVCDQIKQNVIQSAQAKTDTGAANLDAVFSSLNALSNHLSKVPELSPASFLEDHHSAYTELNKRLYKTSNYDSLCIVYQSAKWLLTNDGTSLQSTYFPDSDYASFLSTIFSQKERALYSFPLHFSNSTSKALVYVQPLSSPVSRQKYALLASFKHTTITDLLYLNELYDSASTPIVALYDRDGNCLWSNGKESNAYSAVLSEYALGDSAAQTLRLGDIEYLATRATAANGLITLISLEQTLVQYSQALNSALLLMLGCIALMIVFAFFVLSYGFVRCYKPIQHVVTSYRDTTGNDQAEEKSELEILSFFVTQSYDKHSRRLEKLGVSKLHLQSLFVLSTINEHYASANELWQLQQNLDIVFHHPYYYVCIYLFDAPMVQDKGAELVDLLQSRCEAGVVGYFSMMPDAHTMVGIINSPTGDIEAQQAYFRSTFALSPRFEHATIAVGNCYSSLTEMGKSYSEACSALDYRLVAGCHTIIFSSDLAKDNPCGGEYPAALMQAYLRSLHSWDAAGIHEHLRAIHAYVTEHRISLQMGKCICYELINGFLNQVRSLETGNMKRLEAACDPFSILEYDSMDELIEKIHALSQHVYDYVGQMQAGQNHRFLQQCMEYMEQNITNPQFMLESLADHFGITPQTLRARFKQQTGKTLICAMIELRIDRACTLLRTTKMDIGEIMAAVGYLDNSSFSRLFKKETGLTPSEYRIQHHV